MNKKQYFSAEKALMRALLRRGALKGRKIFWLALFAILALSHFFSHQAFGQASNQTGSGVYIPTDTGLPNTTFKLIFSNFLKWLLLIFGFLAIISFVVTGIMYLTSGGDKERAESAKKQMYWSLVGVIVVLSAFVILQAINTWFGGSSEF